jgi:hypothetical protein
MRAWAWATSSCATCRHAHARRAYTGIATRRRHASWTLHSRDAATHLQQPHSTACADLPRARARS